VGKFKLHTLCNDKLITRLYTQRPLVDLRCLGVTGVTPATPTAAAEGVTFAPRTAAAPPGEYIIVHSLLLAYCTHTHQLSI